ncbi:fungal-specific transcription factor domain-containing protein [Desarmillaria tabescens]|uniref:Fungal-specific transcription factor domain-containing protein n=1 Tax=Armillaria tabescens TaxID=1929756 RepID=A0AA39N0W9_ARMTA|nr:fungal-specific transcription factor domain-containing protein [Desarmillaria tabescens]KAK0454126.1 fungal-specific transcription factor domain-containing protein [Desarmillaria tabescens]
MSSDESTSPPPQPWKKTRLQGACDACRQKKVKCDSATMEGGSCSNCRIMNCPCTHNIPAKKRGPKSNYITRLERKVQHLEEILQQNQPDQGGVTEESIMKDTPDEDDDDDESDLEYIELMDQIKTLSLTGIDDRYFGPSSNLYFMRKALNMKGKQTGTSHTSVKSKYAHNWEIQPWELVALEKAPLFFPPEDLVRDLLDLYFAYFHLYMPLLHEPSFRRSVASGLHIRDHRFGAVPQNIPVGGSGLFKLKECLALSLTALVSTTYNIALSAEYLTGTSAPQSSWTIIGIGIRYAIEMGLHRHWPDNPSVESELKKRAFWCLILLDRHTSFYHGRPPAIRDEDFDLDLPLEVDDEYMESAEPFKQPPGTPSRMVYFTFHLKLCQIMSYALRTLYSIRKSKEAAGLVGQTWAQTNVSELDSMLNKWFDMIPDRLRWDPNRSYDAFFDQSAVLYTVYYNMQIQIHRPFIHKSSPLSFPSLVICTNAAKACTRVLEVQKKKGHLMIFGFGMATFASGIVLIMNMWTGKKSGSHSQKQKDIEESIQKCLNFLEASSKRWNITGRTLDSLLTLSDYAPTPSERDQAYGQQFDVMDFSPGNSYPPLATDNNPSMTYQTLPFSIPQSWAADPTSFGLLEDATASVYNDNVIPSQNDSTLDGMDRVAAEDALEMWSSIPWGFNWDDWLSYTSQMEGMERR